MIEFEGVVGNTCRKYIVKKHMLLALFTSVLVFMILGVPSIFIGIYDGTIIYFLLVLLVMLLIPLFMFFERYSNIPKRISITEIEVEAEIGAGFGNRKLEDIKKIIDKGEFYDIIFYFPNKLYNCICQKDLITQGTIEEFEQIFEDKIVRKR